MQFMKLTILHSMCYISTASNVLSKNRIKKIGHMKIPLIILAASIALVSCKSGPEIKEPKTFQFEMSFIYPGSPDFVYDNLTGDISEWWDHSFSPNPMKIVLEAKPGGSFLEIFDESGDGAKHATVIYAKRGEILRMEGPLGLSGTALTMISTYTLSRSGSNSSNLKLNVTASGEFVEGMPKVVEEVWQHFLWEQFKPYIDKKFEELNTP